MSDRLRAVWAVLPVKAFHRGKSRLGGVLTDPMRAAFAQGLFDHVVGVLLANPRMRGVIVVTDDPSVAERAVNLGLCVVPDPVERTLAAVVDRGLAEAVRLRATAAIVCMADLPTLEVADVDAVLDALCTHDVVIAPDAGEAGTNVLALSPPAGLASCFGHVDSFSRHITRAGELGVEAFVLRRPGLSFDVDGPEDLDRLP